MDSGSIAYIVALVLLLAASAFFSASETAFSSLNHIRLKSMVDRGDKRAARALAVTENYDKMLSTVLVGNNIVNILSSSLATVLFVGWLGNLGVTISTVVMTVAVLLFGEITPKTLAKENPEGVAMAFAPILRGLIVVLTPVNAFFSGWKKMILKLFRVQGAATATEEELLTYVGEVRLEGGINEQEESMIRSAIEFDDLMAIEIATPRVDIVAISLDADDSQTILKKFHSTGYSRLPVYRESLDKIIGVLIEKDFHYLVEDGVKSVEDVIRPILFVPETVKISALLPELQKGKAHMAAVVDEHGGIQGIVTIEDIVEELVGEIWDEHDQIREDIVTLAGDRWRILGGCSLGDLEDLTGLELGADSVTVGGWVVEQLGKIPQKGDHFDYADLLVTVDEMDRNRVAAVIVQRQNITAETPVPE